MYNYLFVLEAVPAGRILGFDTEFLMELGIQWLNTLILTLLLAKFLYNPVKKFMTNRSERISKQIDDANSAEQKALTMKEDYESKLRDIEHERAAIIDAANRQVHDKTEQLMSEARQTADMMRARAHKDIEMEQERVKDDMKREIIDLAAMIAGRFAVVSLDRQAQDKLIAEAITDIGDAKWLT